LWQLGLWVMTDCTHRQQEVRAGQDKTRHGTRIHRGYSLTLWSKALQLLQLTQVRHGHVGVTMAAQTRPAGRQGRNTKSTAGMAYGPGLFEGNYRGQPSCQPALNHMDLLWHSLQAGKGRSDAQCADRVNAHIGYRHTCSTLVSFELLKGSEK
jgi:hypothetical protein